MENNAEVLARIIEEMTAGMNGSRKARQIAEKISSGTATYADAYDYARESSRVMTASMRRNVPDVLTDGRLFRAEADKVIRVPMEQSGKKVAETAAEIQQQLNEAAGIGIRGIEPEINEDQITGIITDICNADSYEAGKENLFTQVENFLEGTVDDCVRENADFQYKAGLSPTIERKADGKCCEWCSRLVGSYPYEDVKDRGNDVFRRHKNCHCQILYNPGDGSKRRQNVHSRQWTEDQDPAKIETRKSFVGLDLQKFAHKSGDYRRMEHGSEWQEMSLKDAVSRYAKGSKPFDSDDKQKRVYRSKDGKYEIRYDKKGDYFRIKDLQSDSEARPYLDKDGKPVLNLHEDGKWRSATKEEYERLTHFRNTDKGGKK